MKKKVDFMVTAFRDGFQSVYGARVFTKDFIPAVEAAVDAGITHFEAGGGARFQSLYFYCNEDAFDMMDQFRAAVGPDINLQTLARGTNVVGLESQSRDVIDLHAKMFAKHGISTIRNFDALNDVNNLIYSGERIVAAGAKHEVCVTMMELPPGATGAHDPDFYMGVLRNIMDAGIKYDSVCFKDASGTSAPAKVYETIKQARALLGETARIVFHSHETAGTSIITYKAAIEAGANQIDLSMAPVSGGTSQPDIVTMWHALRGTDYDLGIDIDKIMNAEEVFKNCMKDYFMPPEGKKVEPLMPFSPMPGGALTANTQMMRDNGIMDKYHDVTAAMGEVIEKGGYGTSVTPVSQFYFQQAFNNVMFGPWKKIADGYGKMVLGYFGKTPVAPDSEIMKLAEKQLGLKPTTKIPVDINDADPEKGIKIATKRLKDANLPVNDENIFISATCKEKGITFLQGNAKIGVRKIDTTAEKEETVAAKSSVKAPTDFTVKVNANEYNVEMKGNKAIVNGVEYNISVKEGLSAKPVLKSIQKSAQPAPVKATPVKPAAAPVPGGKKSIEAPLPGIVLKILKNVGDRVEEDEVVMIVESMKMETEINAPSSGTISELPIKENSQIVAGDTLVVITADASTAPAAALKIIPAAKTATVKKVAQPVKAAPVAKKAPTPKPETPAVAASGGQQVTIEAPLPGLVLKMVKKVGDSIEEDEVVMIVESMKMETEINSTATGTITDIPVKEGDQITAGDTLAVIN
ncbi:MAG: biotin attachment protein [Spirochaetes bacterium]|nr:MAG: biotin attachment protein [Spirochaetota bacterium]